MDKNEFEVIIIGGSYAGLSAALTLGRSLRKTLVIDGGEPCNRQTPHSHNFLTQDGSTPSQISHVAKSQVAKYDSVKFYEGLAIDGMRISEGFEITTSNGDVFTTKKLVLATGIKDIMPDIKGFSECWGISVVHCPYCHGYEIRNKKTAIIANGDRAYHLVSLVNNLSKDITLLTSGIKEFEENQFEKLQRHKIHIIEKKIVAIEHSNGQVERVVFKDGSVENYECVYASIPFEQNSALPKKLGCKLTEHGHIEVNLMQKTSEEGIFSCGDNSSMMRSVATAVYGGTITGAMINNELTQEYF
ncbi:NAD(P)/FAD-dependent oxidoreductase [Reichenbachiella agarivorans]|uniref:NAD(P)/FAD-dependent oxidoreductase n=1 Tax=Reichenbachiella agarivorans TaxID=2979464 RepID=A0ABY6CKL5_9BACT|nr:NAD(P)/FAD-dependent oxidoreductase [Reichenbachiella agarivorans]UXP31055.1 NAD(P)/FAD-dependent oxidoreductase [Reichenbachiella agarivorans]